jgi:hypothetical protein
MASLTLPNVPFPSALPIKKEKKEVRDGNFIFETINKKYRPGKGNQNKIQKQSKHG